MRRRLSVEPLEDRTLLSWGTNPPLQVTLPANPTAVTLNGQGDAGGTASIASAEVDWYRFTTRATGTYVISATGITASFNTVLGFYHTTGRLFGANDDVSSTNKNSRMAF